MKTAKLHRDEHSQIFPSLGGEAFELLFHSNQFAMAISNGNGIVIRANLCFRKFLTSHPDAIHFGELISAMKQNRTIPAAPGNFTVQVPGKIIRLSCIAMTQVAGSQESFLWTMSVEVNLSFRNKIANLKNLYRSFMDTSFELLFRTDAQGKILFANKLFVKSFGWSNHDIATGLFVHDLLEDATQFATINDRIPGVARLADEHLVFKKKNGEGFPAIANIYLHRDTAENQFLNWTVLDITNQKEGEQNLKIKNEELAKVNSQMEKFLYSTSHDLRSPIATILGLVNLMRLEVKTAGMIDYVSKIEISTMKLDKIIKDILSFSKATYQRQNSERIDFDSLAWKAFNNYRDDPTSRKIFFEVNANTSLPFYSDTERLDIILDNIVRNCIHFFDPNKSRPFIKVNISSDKQSAFLEIIDNGIGIGAQHTGNIFKMFYKASHLSKGAGLGLFIVKETVEKLHGTITLESEVGFGTVIRIRIPNDHKGRLIGRKLLLQSNFDVSKN